MVDPTPANLAELRQIEARLDHRLDLIVKAEANLKGLFEALRQQVGNAYPVLEGLKKIIPVVQRQAEVATSALASIPSCTKDTTDHACLQTLGSEFRTEVQQTLAQVRESMLDQIDLLKSQLRLQVDPLLNQLDTAQTSASARIAALVQAHEQSLENRALQLSHSIDEIASTLEERLTQRVMSMQRRADDTITQIEPTIQNRINIAIQSAHKQIDSGESKLQSRLDATHRVLDEIVADTDRQLVDRLHKLEAHAESMQVYLQQKLTQQTDDLIQQLRSKLQDEIAAVAGSSAPVSRREQADMRVKPKLEAAVFVSRITPRPASAA